MEAAVRLKNTGLRGVPVADTKISYIEGHQGVLIYRGYRIEDLARDSSFEETAYLLLNGSLPTGEKLGAFSDNLRASREIPDFVFESLRRWPKNANPMDVLQASVPMLAMADPELSIETREANVSKATRILARMPGVIAGWHRIREGRGIFEPLPYSLLAEGFLWQLAGSQPDPEHSRALDIAMVLQAEHTFNASTFACREIVSTRAHMYAGVSGGVGALSGDLHGGANARVMSLVLRMEGEGRTPGDVAAWVRDRVRKGEIIMGMGHAIYKTFDPRATILKGLCEQLSHRAGKEKLFSLMRTMEEAASEEFEKRGKPQIKANVDFYSGLLYHLLGIPPDLMTPVFAMSLACGWCAHIIEEKFAEAQEKPVLYRPEADYVGDYCGAFGCSYIPVEER